MLGIFLTVGSPYGNKNLTQTEDSQMFNEWLDFNLDAEGKYYENVAGDNGGPTKWGVTWRDANAYFKSKGLPVYGLADAIKFRMSYLSEIQIREIYKVRYWDKIRGGLLPSPADQVISDCAVNAGVSQAVKFMERVVNVQDDGIFDDALLAATLRYIDKYGQKAYVKAFQKQRVAFYLNIGAPGKTNNIFLKGWLSRTTRLDVLAAKVIERKYAAGRLVGPYGA